MNPTNWKDVLERAGWSFLQGSLATVAVVPLITDVEAWAALTVAAISGGVTSVLSFLKTVAQEHLTYVPDTRAR